MSDDQNVLFGELRSVAQGAASAEGWEQLVALIDRWADVVRFEAEALPYLKDQLAGESWQATARVAPPRWVEHEHPALALCDGIDATGLKLKPAALIARIQREARGWRTIKLDGTAADVSVIKAIAAHPGAARLHTLSLRGCKKSGAGLDALAEASKGGGLSGLRALDISEIGCDVSDMNALINSALALRLEALQLTGNAADHRDEIYDAFYSFFDKTGELARNKRSKKITDEDRARAKALYDSVEAQIVEWANDIHAGDDLEIVFESFHDLME